MSLFKETAGPSTRRFHSICVFGGTNLGKDEAFRHAAYDLGKTLAARKINVVYGGGVQGLKGCTAGTAITRGSHVLGVSLMDGNNQKTTNLTLGTTLRVSTMQERMAQMLYKSDAFIALPGGLGTLEDIFTVVSWANSNFHQKPLGFLNVNGFYNGLLSFLEQAMHQGFIPQELQRIMASSSNANELLEQMQNLSIGPHASGKQMDKNNKEDGKKEDPDTTLRL